MDPIHPIIPQPPTIPPVTPAPSSGRIDREGRRDADGGAGRKRRPRPDAALELRAQSEELAYEEYELDDFDEGADGGLHVDISA